LATEPFRRILPSDSTRLSTSSARTKKDRQRKIEFLALHACEGTTVLYAGAAPGAHTEYLADLFPTVKFVLVDPNTFQCKETDRISIRQQLFEDATALEFAEVENLLFISDIRSASHTTQDAEEFNARLLWDNDAQARWHGLCKPRMSMLKLRLPYEGGQTEYLDGLIYLPVWGPQSTTETRLLVPREAGRRVYDHTEYEEQMFHFNTKTRMSCYPHRVEVCVCVCVCVRVSVCEINTICIIRPPALTTVTTARVRSTFFDSTF
jgi:hypothetical protein